MGITTPSSTFKSNNGFSLIELMIASFLGLLILAFCFHLFQSSKISQQLSTEVIKIQSRFHTAEHILKHGIEHAGFTSSLTEGADFEFKFPKTELFQTGQIIQLTKTSLGQEISVRLQGDESSTLRDCAGKKLIPHAVTVMTYSINSENALLCTIERPATEATAANLKTFEENIIVHGIKEMHAQIITQKTEGGVKTIRTESYLAQNADEPAEKTLGLLLELILSSDQPVRSEAISKTLRLYNGTEYSTNDRYFHEKSSSFYIVQNQRK